MSIAFSSATTVSANSGSGVNITVASGDTLLIVHGIDNSTNLLTAVSATCGGVAMTQLGTINNNVPNDQFCLYLLNPPVGTQSVVITEVGGTAHLSRAVLYSGTITSGWTPNFAQGNGTNNVNLSTTFTTNNAGSWVVACFRNDSSAPSGTAPATARGSTANNIMTTDTNGTVSPGSQNIQFTNGNSGQTEYFAIEVPIPTVVSTAPDLRLAFI